MHGDAAKDIALQVPDAGAAYREAVARGARGIAEPQWVEDEHGRVELATIGTYGENVHTFVNRAEYTGPYLPGYVSLSPNGHRGKGVGLIAIESLRPVEEHLLRPGCAEEYAVMREALSELGEPGSRGDLPEA